MSYLPKSTVVKNIKTRKRVCDGRIRTVYDAYLGYDPISGKQFRLQNKDYRALKSEIDSFYSRYRRGGDIAVRLNAWESAEARQALDLLAQHGKSVSLVDVVRDWLGNAPSRVGNAVCVAKGGMDKTLHDAYGLFTASLVGKSAAYMKAIRHHVGKFVAEFGGDAPIADIKADAIIGNLKKRVLDQDDVKTWKTYNNHLGDLKTFFGWCARSEQGYIPQSPIQDVKKLTLPYRDPEYVDAQDVAKLFTVLARHVAEHPADLAHAILSFFCGMRQSEIERISEGRDAVHIALDAPEPFIRVVKQKGSTCGKRPRAFKIPEQALAWMRSFDFMKAAMNRNGEFRRHLTLRAKEAGINLPKNAGRHTFITMYSAAYHDQAKLTSIVGNTEGVRMNSYDGVEIETNGKAYFSILPE